MNPRRNRATRQRRLKTLNQAERLARRGPNATQRKVLAQRAEEARQYYQQLAAWFPPSTTLVTS